MPSVFDMLWGVPRKQTTEREKTFESVRREEMFGRQMEELKEKERQLQQQMEQFSKGMDAKLAQVSIQMDSGLENLNGKLDSGLESLNGKLDSGLESLNGKLDSGLEGLNGKLDLGFGSIEKKLDVCKGELSDKVHSENVKSYRNVQALVEELTEKLEAKEQGGERKKSARGLLRAVLIVGILNLLTMAGWILYELGIISMFL